MTLITLLKHARRSWLRLAPAGLILTVVAALSAQTSDGPTAARANSYDDGWQSDWIAHASVLLRGAEFRKTSGFVLEIGDSITHSYAWWCKN